MLLVLRLKTQILPSVVPHIAWLSSGLNRAAIISDSHMKIHFMKAMTPDLAESAILKADFGYI